MSLKGKLKKNWNRVRDTLGGGSPWNDFREVSSPDPYSIAWDEASLTPYGLTGPPTPDQAPRYQFRAEELARKRENFLFGEAHGQLQTAMGIFSRYQLGGPSGGAMMGLYRDRANLFGQQAQLVEAPDFMYRSREDAQIRAAREQKRASRMQLAAGLVQAAATLPAAFATGGAALLPMLGASAISGLSNAYAAHEMSNALGTMQDTRTAAGMSSGGPETGAFGGEAPMIPQRPGMDPQYQGVFGGIPGMPGAGGAPMVGPAGGAGGGSAQLRLGGQPGMSGGGVGGPSAPGFAPGGGPSGGGPQGAQQGQQRAPGQGAPGGASGGAGGAMGMQGPPNGGFGQDGDFTPKALASAAVRVDPDVEAIVTLAFANWLDEDKSTDHWEAVVAERMLDLLEVA